MQCSECQAENPDNFRFCEKCGKELTKTIAEELPYVQRMPKSFQKHPMVKFSPFDNGKIDVPMAHEDVVYFDEEEKKSIWDVFKKEPKPKTRIRSVRD